MANEYGNNYKPKSGEKFYGEQGGPNDWVVETYAANGRTPAQMEARAQELLRTKVPDGYERTVSVEKNFDGSEYIVLKTKPSENAKTR